MKQKVANYDNSEYVLFYDKENPDNGYLMTREVYSMIKDTLESENEKSTEYFVKAYKLEKVKEEMSYDEYGIVPSSSIDFPVKRMYVPFLTPIMKI